MRDIASLSRFDLFECMVNNVKVIVGGEVCVIRGIKMINFTGNLFTVDAKVVGGKRHLQEKSLCVRLNTLTRTCEYILTK